MTENRLYTIGHSTRSAEEFRAMLQAAHIELLIDVRKYPGSRRYPHFSSEALAASLGEVGIAYHHLPALGGRRKPSVDSPNTYWHNASFRAYADYMATREFALALGELLSAARERPTAVMCAEAVPWRCHRWLISDAALVAGFDVVHLVSPGKSQPHELNPAARVAHEGFLVYAEAI